MNQNNDFYIINSFHRCNTSEMHLSVFDCRSVWETLTLYDLNHLVGIFDFQNYLTLVCSLFPFQLDPSHPFDRWKHAGTQKWQHLVQITQMTGIEPTPQPGLLPCSFSFWGSALPEASHYQRRNLCEKNSPRVFFFLFCTVLLCRPG